MRDYTGENSKLLSPDRHTVVPEQDGVTDGVGVLDSRDSALPTLRITTPSGRLHLHSSYDPVEEARRWAELRIKDGGYSRIFVFGFGLGYHVEALLELNPQTESLTAVEVNPGVFSAALAARPLEKILADPRVRIIAGAYPAVAARIQAVVDEFSAGGGETKVFVHKPSLDAFPEDAYELRAILEYILLSSSDNPVFPKLKKENIERNRDAFDAAPGVSGLFGALAGKPAVVAAAGPSLDISLQLLKSRLMEQKRDTAGGAILTDRAWRIITVDSALAPFHAAGLRPDFVVTGDPQPGALKLFEGLDLINEKLIFFNSSCPAVVGLFGPEHRLAARPSTDEITDPAAGEEDRLSKGELYFSGTVFLAAVDFAVKTGADPVIVIGADFSFSEDRTHASGSRTQGYIPRYGRIREVPGLDGKPVRTSDILFLYLRDFEKYCSRLAGKTRIINCTARGADVPGVPHASFESFLKNFR